MALVAAPINAQTDSSAVEQRNLAPERIGVFDISNPTLNRKQSEGLTRALIKTCQEEARFVAASEVSLAAYLKKRRRFSIFIAASAQALCKNLALDYLIVSTFERTEPSEQPSPHQIWQVTLRWLDGSTGQMTKIHAQDRSGDINAPDSFPLRELLTGLLESPEIIIPVENSPTEMPALTAWSPEMHMPAVDSSAIDQINNILPPDQTPIKRSRSWFWYVTGAALVSGGSAAFLLRNSAKSGTVGKILLPEPPEPPK